jgi:hypothetical protein
VISVSSVAEGFRFLYRRPSVAKKKRRRQKDEGRRILEFYPRLSAAILVSLIELAAQAIE